MHGFFEKEVDNLTGLRRYDGLPHLIKAIAAYQIGQDRCLMFPWAEGGNLSEYWQSSELHRHNYQGLLWVVDQFVGICSVFDKLHERNGRHGDLKPENILWFKDEGGYGIFKVADWGLSTFHKKGDNTKMRNEQGKMTSTPSGTSRYAPPETPSDDDEVGAHKPRSRLYDIWSIGCIMVELLVWLVEGFESIEALREETRHFWVEVQNGHRINTRVNTLLNKFEENLKKFDKRETIYRDFLKLVREDLLVIQFTETSDDAFEKTGQPQKLMRKNAQHVHDRMKAIRKKCVDEAYLFPLTFESPLLDIKPSNGRSGGFRIDGRLAAGNVGTAPESNGTSGQAANDGNDSEGESIAVPTNWNHQSINAQNSTMSDTQAVSHSRSYLKAKHQAQTNDELPVC